MITVAAIKTSVARHYRVPRRLIDSRSRNAEAVTPRHVAMCLATRLTEHSLARLGSFFQRDRKTISHAHRSIHRRLASDDEMRLIMRSVTRELLWQQRGWL
jgi:chromosomal replication initiator protein